MFLLHKPSEENLERFLKVKEVLAYSYPEVGSTSSIPPQGYSVDHNRIILGKGGMIFDRAVEALRCWHMFDTSVTTLYRHQTPIAVGETVIVVAKHLGFYSLNASRIVYLINAGEGDILRFGFAYGTLPGHAQHGEERFLVEWNLSSDDIWYDLYAFSRPQRVLTRLGYVYGRYLQKRFAQESKAAMLRAVRNEDQALVQTA